MKKLSSVWLFSERKEHYSGLVTAATALGETVKALAEVSNLPNINVDVLYTLKEPAANHCVEDYAETIAEVIKQAKPAQGLLLLSTGKRDKALAARLSILLDASLVNDATNIRLEDGKLLVEHLLYGGLALGEKKVNTPFVIVTIPSGAFSASVSEPKKTVSGQGVLLNYVPPHHSLMCQARYSKPFDNVELTKAKCVVGIGRGLAAQDDLALIQSLANCLNAEVGCSRPISEGEHWLGRERYIGISGVMLNCEVYLALGISGQIQHMVGVNDAKVVIAINKDKNAPIFQFADYGIVGDLYVVVPMLIEKLQS
ncbi:electron transfer flavoprotein subunit alpha [Salmonella enterica]|nr:electron transfer flavoprotein subunit alpha [Salmonella enterica]EAA9596617.1 electron transfer flavoprotein subunit alpha [Salmonella enterica]EAO9639146.1 electron transfer flavoprotein subunit alpha [Salmonella enterica]EKI3325690.1 FAD-binding protein [Salmonella enterica]HAC8238552.1 electron transfer flavoprotein subunit alpha [Salmonella enterica]